MHRATGTVISGAILLISGCAGLMGPSLEEHTEAARKATTEFQGKLKTELGAAMGQGGPMNAIEVCHTKANAIAEAASTQSGMRLSRTSLKLRNPANVSSAWQTKVLEEFEARRSAGEDPAKLEFAAIAGEGAAREFRYMKAIVIPADGKPCLACHGANVEANVRARLDALYPQDRAIGYQAGDLRGAFVAVQAIPTR